MASAKVLAGQISRREALGMVAALCAIHAIGSSGTSLSFRRISMTITCIIRYQIDPFQRDAFKKYAENWGVLFLVAEGILSVIFFPMRARMMWGGV